MTDRPNIAGPSRLALGTAQLGMDYGVANVVGKLDSERAAAVVEAAWETGINCFDTAQSYGRSEAVLGAALRKIGAAGEALVITKLAPELGTADGDEIVSVVEASLAAVGVPSFFGLLLHREDWLADWETVYRARLAPLAEKGLVRQFGVSIYDTDSFELALTSPDLALIQVPFSVFDQRAARLGWFDKARSSGKLLFVRSVFLQGLLLLEADESGRVPQFARARLKIFRDACVAAGLSPTEACLGYALAKADGAVIVFGAETPEQVRETAGLARRLPESTFPTELFDGLAEPFDSPLIDPRRWPSSN